MMSDLPIFLAGVVPALIAGVLIGAVSAAIHVERGMAADRARWLATRQAHRASSDDAFPARRWRDER